MRIALLPSAFAPWIGGVEELTRRLALQLSAAGDDVEVWTIRHPKALAACEEIEGLRVRRFDLPLPTAHPRSLATLPIHGSQALAALMRAARSFRPDILHVQCFSANGIYASGLSRIRSVPLVVSLQGETVMDAGDIYGRSTTLRLGLRAGLRSAAAVTACSEFVLADAECNFGLQPGRGAVIPNGVDVAGDAEPRALALPFDRFVLGLGRLVWKKGFDLLLDAFATLASGHPDLGLVIGGAGPELAPLRERVAALGLGERVVLPGALSRGEVAWATRNASVFVLPSRVEPFGIVVLEALRARRPVVVSSRGGAREIVRDGLDGLLADPEDVAGLAAAIGRLLDDELLAAALAASGAERVRTFAWDGIAARYRDLYRRVA